MEEVFCKKMFRLVYLQHEYTNVAGQQQRHHLDVVHK